MSLRLCCVRTAPFPHSADTTLLGDTALVFKYSSKQSPQHWSMYSARHAAGKSGSNNISDVQKERRPASFARSAQQVFSIAVGHCRYSDLEGHERTSQSALICFRSYEGRSSASKATPKSELHRSNHILVFFRGSYLCAIPQTHAH